MSKLLAKIINSPISSSLSELPAGKDGVIKTLAIMSQLVDEYKSNTDIRRLSVALCGRVKGNTKDYLSQVNAIFRYVQREIGYIRDIRGVETIQTPIFTLQSKSGDCDDKSTLLATMLESLGFATRFFAMGFTPGIYSHVICEVNIKGVWVSLDATENHPMGWLPPKVLIGYYFENPL